MPDTRQTIPTLGTVKGVQYFAQTSDNQWFYLNHAGKWESCPPLSINLSAEPEPSR